MLTASLLSAGAPAWVRGLLEIGSLLLGAQLLLDTLRRGRLGTIALAAAAWVWFFYPPGHVWMLSAGRQALHGGTALLAAMLGHAMHAAGQATVATTSAPGAHASLTSSGTAATGGGVRT